MEIDKKKNKSLEHSVDSSRREFVAKAVKASAFAVPLALSVETLTAKKAYAQTSDASSGGGGGTTESSDSSGPASVPEPAAVTLLGIGIASLALQARRQQKLRSKKES